MQLVETCDEILVWKTATVCRKTIRRVFGYRMKVNDDSTLSQDGELNRILACAVGKQIRIQSSGYCRDASAALCEGCGHRDMYTTLTQILKEEYPTHKVFSDIGCYTLGANAPFNAINFCVDMGHPLRWQRCCRWRIISA